MRRPVVPAWPSMKIRGVGMMADELSRRRLGRSMRTRGFFMA
jgi:hypothetical protein